jgi:kinetochore protein Spc7/SPC105
VFVAKRLSNYDQSAFPNVKSILAVNSDHTLEDIAKRKEARRKSLARRRVSFAPEATLHEWNVEYVIDNTTSSSSSSSASDTRQAVTMPASAFKSPQISSKSPNESTRSASASPEKIPESPAETDVPPKKRRRGSSTGTLSFDTVGDGFTSPAKEDVTIASDSDMGDATMDLDVTEQGLQDSGDSTSSSARLDAALRHAAQQAGTQHHLDLENGDMTMEMADDDVTNAFKPWIESNRRDSVAAPRLQSLEDQENINPFGKSQKRTWSAANEETLDMSMDMTRAIGGILQKAADQTEDLSMDITRAVGGIIRGAEETQDLSMDITRAIGGIVRGKTPEVKAGEQGRSTRSRRSSAMIAPTTASSGSPIERPRSRRSLRGRPSAESNMGDETMDFTTAVGGIRQATAKNLMDESFEDATMDFTMAVGSIKSTKPTQLEMIPDNSGLEDLSMDLTENLGKTLAQSATPSTPNSRLAEPILPPSVTVERGKSPKSRSPAAKAKLQAKSPRRSPRKSLNLEFDEAKFQNMSNLARKPHLESLTQPLPFLSAPRVVVEPPAEMTQPLPKTVSLADSLRKLGTPRKEILTAPSLKPSASLDSRRQSPTKFLSPTKSTPRANRSPSKGGPSPRRRVNFNESPGKAEQELYDEEESDAQRISLPEFLDMTNIRFMDLTTTKRRATGHPGANGMLGNPEMLDEGPEPSFENNVAAAAAVVPTLVMYQHACREMKSYMSTSRKDLRVLEKESLAAQPPLFREYMLASGKERSIMDAQLRDLKTNARHNAKSGWHTWRSQLLNDLKGGCIQANKNLQKDEARVAQVEVAFNEILPGLIEKQGKLDEELQVLERRKQQQEENSGAEIEKLRAKLAKVQMEQEAKKNKLAMLHADLAAKEEAAEEARGWRSESQAAIQEAERVCEEYRGWSIEEVNQLQTRLDQMETQFGWSLVSAEADSITLAHKGLLQVTLHPRAWRSKGNRGVDARSPNAPVKITFIGRDKEGVDLDHDAPIPTIRRFFLQLLRARVLALPQSTTRASSMLDMLASGWKLAQRVEKEVSSLEAAVGVTDVAIVGDERLAIETMMLLPSLTTKVKVRIEISVEGGVPAVDGVTNLQADVHVTARVAYGEKYDESKMGSYLGKEINQKTEVRSEKRVSDRRWAHRVHELRGELLKRGKKGVRV